MLALTHLSHTSPPHSTLALKRAQYSIHRFLTNPDDDYIRFDATFDNRINFTKPIHGEVKAWVAENIDRWRAEKPKWFEIDMIPDDFLPERVVIAEGGAQRRRSSVSLRELIGGNDAKTEHV